MIDVLSHLDEREEEFARHLSIARMLEARVDDLVDEGDIHVEVRHINTLKSGLLIHLYNIVEAITTRTLTAVGQTVVTEAPRRWTALVLKEWVRSEIWSGEERIGDGALRRLTQVSGTLASGNNPTEFVVKGEPGSWDDKSIRKVAERLGCQLVLSRRIKRAAYEKAFRDDTTALEYLARKRNAIAHGASTFEGGANELTLDDLEGLARRVLPYLRAVSESYQTFLESKKYLIEAEIVA
ncbi:MAE_28990/MAE_18760 family HEPN-like nuclease [uncultured Jannaschia sp.]|uniref:MAE_28990/MAE_18760 family HEPN-like nuclease n=1 Tax=uncultured Jannaschia sp. TaxID=293347 RepID=UPI00262C9548|nr:MAE_28990/MAE_18760 family HEPN-like nuclease [uncultured Jannaschia sp.]